MHSSHRGERGFTLIELSIVLVIIGLIVGGVLTGQDLIRAATARAQVTQIEKFNQAANAFFGKFGALPGDITQQAVTSFGFTGSPIRPGGTGGGDGNGELDGNSWAWNQSGETLFFWVDLSTNSNLIEGAFNLPGNGACSSAAACSVYLPYSKLGNGSFVYVYSGYANNCCSPSVGFGPNFFGLSFINSIAFGGNIANGAVAPAPALTTNQAYAIDKKIDDGLPQTGNVLAQYLVAGTGYVKWSTNGASPTASTCFDTSSGTAAYSISFGSGSLVNCGISFKMQAGD